VLPKRLLTLRLGNKVIVQWNVGIRVTDWLNLIFLQVGMHSNITMCFWYDKDEGRMIGVNVVVIVEVVVADEFEVGIEFVHVNAVIDNVLVIPIVAFVECNDLSMRE
jgi:hypothetical protein